MPSSSPIVLQSFDQKRNTKIGIYTKKIKGTNLRTKKILIHIFKRILRYYTFCILCYNFFLLFFSWVYYFLPFIRFRPVNNAHRNHLWPLPVDGRFLGTLSPIFPVLLHATDGHCRTFWRKIFLYQTRESDNSLKKFSCDSRFGFNFWLFLSAIF